MAEPKVGMKFSTYNSLTSDIRRDGEKNNNYLKDIRGKNYNQTSFYQSTALGSNFAYTMVEERNPKHVIATYEHNLHSEYQTSLTFTGATNNYNGDVKFSRIVGDTTYAIDKNGNGIVDKGEIFKNKENCAVPIEDEASGNLNVIS